MWETGTHGRIFTKNWRNAGPWQPPSSRHLKKQATKSCRVQTETTTLPAARFAEFETNLRRERQLEGIAKAKAAGVYKGRKPNIDPTEVRRLKAEGLGASEIAKALKIGRASVYRVL